MDIGVSTATFYPTPTEDTIELVSSVSAGICEVFLESISEYDDSFTDLLNEKLRQNKLKVISCHGLSGMYEPLIFSDYKRRSRDSINLFTKLARATSRLGGKYITFHGNRLEPNISDFDYKSFARIMDELCDISLGYGLYLAWENVSWCRSGDPMFIERALQYIKNDIRFTFDIKQAKRANISPENYINVMGKKIVNVHINDYDDKNICLLPGQGTVDFRSILKLLRKYSYNGDFIIEVYGDNYKNFSEINQSLEYLRKIFSVFST